MNSFKELSLPYFKDVFEIIDNTLKENKIEYYLIGAQARNYHFLEKGIKPGRGTMDIDFAVMLPEMSQYEEMKLQLTNRGFRKASEPYRLIHDESNTVIDLLPFGEIEEKGTVRFIERDIELSVIGMKEVNTYATYADIEGVSIKISPLEGLVILKLISFSEKSERKKDLDDICDILKSYFDINTDRFYADHLDVVGTIAVEYFTELAGAILLGRDMKKILMQSEKLSQEIEAIIKKELAEEPGSITQYFLSKEFFNDYGLVKNIFTQLYKGIKE